MGNANSLAAVRAGNDWIMSIRDVAQTSQMRKWPSLRQRRTHRRFTYRVAGEAKLISSALTWSPELGYPGRTLRAGTMTSTQMGSLHSSVEPSLATANLSHA